jgi:hypothetical protein
MRFYILTKNDIINNSIIMLSPKKLKIERQETK